MARPRKEGLEYFPLDVDFFDDEKLIAVSGKFGITGEVVTLRLLMAIYRRGYFMEWNEMLGFKIMRFVPGLTHEVLDGIVRYLVKCDFFDRVTFEHHSVLTSRGIQRRYFHSVAKRTIDGTLPHLLIPLPNLKVMTPRPAPKPESGKEEHQVPTNTPSIPPTTSSTAASSAATSSTATPPDSKSSYQMTVKDEIEALKKDSVWVESFTTLYGLTRDEVLGYLGMFVQEQYGAKHTSLDDARSHVARWLRKVRTSPGKAGIAHGTLPTSPRSSEAELRRRRDERQKKEQLEREEHSREKLTAEEYLKSKGLDPTANIAELIKKQLADEEAALIKDNVTEPSDSKDPDAPEQTPEKPDKVVKLEKDKPNKPAGKAGKSAPSDDSTNKTVRLTRDTKRRSIGSILRETIEHAGSAG